MSAHTPGPWKIERASDPGPFHFHYLVDATDKIVASTWAPPSESESEANARLIAAAPDLLEALRGVVRVADRKTDEFDAAHAAIAKATGAA